MSNLTFSQPALTPLTNPAPLLANRRTPLEVISFQEFELLTFWLYGTEIRDGNWRGKYEEIRLMQASADKARDCMLYKGGQHAGVMQCKHSQNPLGTLRAPAFAKEVIKFGLYSIAFDQDIQISNDFPYYIVSSNGFHEDCDNFIDDFQNQVDTHPAMENWITKVIEGYSSIKHLKYADVEKELRSRLKKLIIHRIGPAELSRLLKSAYQTDTLAAFFTYQPVADPKMLQPLIDELSVMNRKMDSLAPAPVLPPDRPAQLPFDGTYIERSVIIPGNELFAVLGGVKKSLRDELREHNHIALLGWGQTGKTTELLRLANVLSGPDQEDHVFYIKLDVYTDAEIAGLVPRLAERDPQKVLVLLDGLDEVLPEWYGTAIARIKAFTRDYPEVRTIVSCRDNFYTSFAASDPNNTLPPFLTLKLQELDNDAVNAYLSGLEDFDLPQFVYQAKEKDVEELLKNPFYLIRFAEGFQQTGKIMSGKADLFKDLLDEGVLQSVSHVYPLEVAKFIERLTAALEDIALAMELRGKNFFTLAELDAICNDPAMSLLVRNTGRILFGEADPNGAWRFVHHNMQEYLAARLLARQADELIKTTITRDVAQKIIKPSWAHAISFLISLLENRKQLRTEIVDLLVENEPGLFMNFEPENLSQQVRNTVFRKITATYTLHDTRLNHTKFQPAQLARFSQTAESLAYVLQLLENPLSDNQLMNALEIAAFYRLANFPALRPRYKAAVRSHFGHANAYVEFLAVRALIQLFRLEEDEFKELFVRYQHSDETYIRFILNHAIWQQGYSEAYLFYVTAQIREIMLEERRSEEYDDKAQRLGNESYELLSAVQSVVSEKGMGQLLTFYGDNLGPLYYSIVFREVIKHLFTQLSKMGSEPLFQKVLSLYTANYREFNGHYRSDEILAFFKKSGRLSEVLQASYRTAVVPGWDQIASMQQLVDEAGLDFLEQEVREGRFDLEQAGSLQWQLNDKNPDWLENWNTRVNKYLTLPMPVVLDWDAINRQTRERKAAVLFSADQFKEELGNLFLKIGKFTLRWDDLHILDPKDRVDYNFYYWLFRNVERGTVVLVEFNLPGAIADIEAGWPDQWIHRLFQFLKVEPKWEPDETQLGMIRAWVDEQVGKLNFRDSFGFLSDEGGLTPETDPMVICSYLIRRFNFTHYSKKTYLDMLSLYRYNDTETDIFEFVLKRCGRDAVIERVFDELNAGRPRFQVLQNHLNFISNEHLVDAAPLLLPFLQKKGSYAWQEVLDLYRRLGGDMEPLKNLWSLLDQYQEHILIRAFAESDPVYIVQYLEGRLQQEADELRRLEIARLLIRLQGRSGLQTYFDHIKKSQEVPDISAPGNPLYAVRDPQLTDLVLEIYTYAYEGPVKYVRNSDLSSIATQMLQGLAFAPGNFSNFQQRFSTFLDQKRMQQQPGEADCPLVAQGTYWLEGLEHRFFLNDEIPVTQEQAVTFLRSLPSIS